MSVVEINLTKSIIFEAWVGLEAGYVQVESSRDQLY